MTLSVEEKINLSNYRLEKAKESLNDSSLLFSNKSYNASANRSYYAVLLAARSLLILRGIDPESHEGVKIMFAKEYIKTELLPVTFSDYFRNLQGRRIDSDYSDYVEINKIEAEDSLTKAKEFIVSVEKLQKEIVDKYI